MYTLRQCVPLLIGALIASACSDPGPATGDLIISITGLPAGAQGAVRVAGPNQFSQVIRATTTLENMPAGTYYTRVDTVTVVDAQYGVAIVRDTIQIGRGRTETATAAYHVASGRIDLTATGLPAGASLHARLNGPLGFTRTVDAVGIIGSLPPGNYLLIADTAATALGDRYAPSTASLPITVLASLVPMPTNLSYSLASATLVVRVYGLPGGADPSITVTGPAQYSRMLSAGMALHGMRAGTYTVSAANTNVSTSCTSIYTASNLPTPLVQTLTLPGPVEDSVVVTYTTKAAPSEWLNLRVDNIHLVQVTQNYEGSVPILSDRPALLRVFGVANQCNTVAPKVRVTLSDGTVLLLLANDATVTTSPNQGMLQSSWNVLLPAAVVKPGLTVVAEIDPDQQVAESDESDNRYPETGAMSVDVHAAPVVGLRFVPVAQTTPGGLIGDVSNVNGFTELGLRIHPIARYEADVHTVFTTSQPLLQSSNTNGSWGNILSEISMLRTLDHSPRYYYGVVRVSYSTGVAGIGYIGGKAALGWDYLPSGSDVFAHEIGHNYGRYHTPCGGPGGIDPQYPSDGMYVGGHIGQYGYDVTDGKLREPEIYSDVMGYCSQKWISDYTYVGMLNYLEGPSQGPSLPIRVATTEEPSLLIWGRIVNGEPVLEPAFEVSAFPEMPNSTGPYRITAKDDNGADLFSFSFSGQTIADLPGNEEAFSFTVPRSMLRGRTLGSLRLDAQGKSVSSGTTTDVAADPDATVTRSGPRALRLRWNAARFPAVLVRDPVDGHVLSIARYGDATVVTTRGELELNYSNKVRSVRRTIVAR